MTRYQVVLLSDINIPTVHCETLSLDPDIHFYASRNAEAMFDFIDDSNLIQFNLNLALRSKSILDLVLSNFDIVFAEADYLFKLDDLLDLFSIFIENVVVIECATIQCVHDYRAVCATDWSPILNDTDMDVAVEVFDSIIKCLILQFVL